MSKRLRALPTTVQACPWRNAQKLFITLSEELGVKMVMAERQSPAIMNPKTDIRLESLRCSRT